MRQANRFTRCAKMTKRNNIGGVIHTYQRYDPVRFPSPTEPPPDLLSGAFEHMMMFGSMRDLTEEELARAVRIDPSQIAGLGPSLDALLAMLRERKRKILEKYETAAAQNEAQRDYRETGRQIEPPGALREAYDEAFEEEQLYDLERLWYRLKKRPSGRLSKTVRM